MKILLQKIIDLPELKLTEPEWQIVLTILKSLFTLSIKNFKKLAENRGELNETTIKQVTVYLKAWRKMTNKLITWNENLSDIWLALNHKNFVVEHLLPITIALLPPNTSQLKLLENKLEIAKRIEQNSDIAYYITNLLAAIKFKLNPVQDKSMDSESGDVHLLLEELDAREKLPGLQNDCKVALENLEKNMKDFAANIKTKHPDIYKIYHTDSSQNYPEQELESIIINNIFDDLKKSTALNIPDNTIADVQQAYQHIKNLNKIFNKDKHAYQKLTEFNENYKHHKQLLSKFLINPYVPYNPIYEYLSEIKDTTISFLYTKYTGVAKLWSTPSSEQSKPLNLQPIEDEPANNNTILKN